ncbi:MAG: hypothetical protein V1750_07490 [Acidobacteriota bacterium]
MTELLAGIRQGLVPRAIRLFAAQGLLPVSREDLIRLLVLLAGEGDAEIAGAARATLNTFNTDHFLTVLNIPDLAALEIDLLARFVELDVVRERVVRHPRTADETLRWLAGSASPRLLETLVANQTRLLGCLEILADLRGNPHVTPDTLRRVREFEEEFLEKAAVWALAGDAEPVAPVGPSIEEALASLGALGMQIPGSTLKIPPLPEPEKEAAPEIRDAFLRLALLNTYQRIMRALKGTREERLILIRDRNPLIVRAVMMSPKLSEPDVEIMAGQRSVTEEALRLIGTGRRWLRRYGIVRNLVFNPKTPAAIALSLIKRMSEKDLGRLSREKNVAEVVRRGARDLRDRIIRGGSQAGSGS